MADDWLAGDIFFAENHVCLHYEVKMSYSSKVISSKPLFTQYSCWY